MSKKGLFRKGSVKALIYEKLQEGLLNPDIVKAVQKNFKMTEEFLLEEIKSVKAAKER
jgi:hypothetical protein